MPAAKRRMEYMDLDAIEPADRNPKGHAEDLIAASIDRFGLMDTPMLDERTGKLVGGHGRVDALKQLRDAGAPAPDGVTVTAGKWRTPVQRGWASANDTEALAAGVALNRLTERGGWTGDLYNVLDELITASTEELDLLYGLGFDQPDVDLLLTAQSPAGVDVDAEWVGMPDYTSENLKGITCVVHFKDDADADRFFALIERTRTRTMWWPDKDGHIGQSVDAGWKQ